MANTMTSLEMSLPIPVVGVDLGPDWALNINACLTIIDSHDHTAGRGVAITPNGLNINTDLSFLGNGSTNLKYTRFNAQGSPLAGALDKGELYVSGNDLYFNDIAGNQVRMTISGGVNAGAGSISNLVSPASATYVSGNSTFVWQSAVNTAANMDFASIILRNLTLNSFGLTLAPPNAMGADYTIVFPALPGALSVMSLDNSGNMGSITYPLQTPSLADGSVTQPKLYTRSLSQTATAGNIGQSNLTGGTVSGVGLHTISNLVTLTTTGRPVMIIIVGGFGAMVTTSGSGSGDLLIQFDGVGTFATYVGPTLTSANFNNFIHVPSAGTHTYQLFGDIGFGGGSIAYDQIGIIAYEIN